MAMVCPSCGIASESGAKFCTECGHALAASPAASLPLPTLNTEPPPGSELVVEVETGRPFKQHHAALLRFRVTNNLHGPCGVTIRVQLNGQGHLVEQRLEEVEQRCQFHDRGDQRVFSLPFRGLVPGDVSVEHLSLVIARPEKPGESTVYELPDWNLFVHVADSAAAGGHSGIVISGGIHIDLSQMKEMYGSDIKNLLNLQAGSQAGHSTPSLGWQPICLRFKRQEVHETLPKQLRLTLPGGVAMDLVRIRAGEFVMGSGEEEGKPDEHTARRVRISRDFYLGKYPVTAEQYRAVLGEEPSKLAVSPQHPVDNVSWADACRFCQRFRSYLVEHPDSLGDASLRLENVALPTEAQWEYACRAGTASRWPFGDDRALLVEYGWCDKNSGRKTQPVGQLKPNAWGLFDMLGNVWEWCRDWHGSYAEAAADDPQGPAAGQRRVLRGGSCTYYASDCRPANRHTAEPNDRTPNYGFRIAVEAAAAPS